VGITGLIAAALDPTATVLAVDCDSEPAQDTLNIRVNRPCREVGV
jgi:hypothetical protein